jgi:hypothetical protein
MDDVSRRPRRAHGLTTVLAAAVLAATAFLIAGCGASGGLEVFNGCITHIRFLALARHQRDHGVVDTITDRSRDAVVGEVTTKRGSQTLGGAAATNGRYVMSTAAPLGRDAGAIERCWDRYSPVDPNS